MAYIFDEDKSKIETRDDIQEQVNDLETALGNLKYKARGVEGGQEREFALLNGTRATLVCHSTDRNGNMIVNINCATNGSVTIRTLVDGGLQEVVTDGPRNLVIRNMTAVTAYWAMFIYSGDINNG